MIKKIVLLLFLFQFSFAQLTTIDELNNVVISAITKDGMGRLWMATPKGLYGYDGSIVLKFTSRSVYNAIKYDDLNGIIYNPKTKKLNITTTKGLFVFDPYTFASSFIQLDTSGINVQKNHFIDPVVDDRGDTWFANKQGDLCKLENNNKISTFDASVPIPLYLKRAFNNPFTINQLSISNNKLFYYTSQCIISYFDLTKKEPKAISFGNRSYITTIQKNDQYLIFDFNGIHLRNKNDTIDLKFSSKNIINIVRTYENGEIWYVLNKTQLYKLNDDLSSELVYDMDIDIINKHKHITNIYVDKNKVWLGTARGLIMVNKPNKAFNKIFESLDGYSASELSSRGIAGYNDSVVICGGYNFLVKYNVKSKKAETLIPKKEAQTKLSYAFYLTHDSLFITGEGSGLNLFDLKQNKFKPIEYKDKFSKTHYTNGGLITSINKIDSCLFFGEYGFLGSYNLYTKHINNNLDKDWLYPWFKDKCSGITQILRLNINEVLILSNGKIFITDQKLHVKFKIELNDPNNVLQEYKILNVMVDNEGKFWISTDKGGLCRYDRENSQKQWYTTENGLCDNSVYYSVQSNDGRIWVATNFGLSVIDLKKKSIKNYFEEDGIANNEFNTNSYFKAPNGDLYFGGMKGVTRIIPSNLEIDDESEKLILNSINMAGDRTSDSLYLSDLSNIKNITLPNRSRFLKVSFALMNFSNKNKYEFRLLGSDSVWINLGNTSQVIFNSLEPGTYTLEVRGWNERGDLVPNKIVLPLIVEQVFYLKAWFIISFIVFIVVLIGSIFLMIYRLKVKGLNQMAEMRLKIATDLHDQVGGLLNKTASQAEVAQMKLKQEDNSLTKIADNSRVALHSMRDIMWNLDPRNDDPESLVVRMSEYAQTMLENSNLYELHLNELKEIKLSHEVRQVINTVFKEAINNIVKHAPNERVLVNAQLDNEHLILTIHNIGTFQTKNEFAGQGLRNMKMRIERVGGQFSIDKTDGVTLKFIINYKKH